ncbi:hypothetical protein [Bradyrhizobium cytisi]|uniref:Uncharacterized protein n=1 Tax=Bradyrhizobium cytisi TaxID=515489 RepID=A0A5S4VU61_9BRAD|nr:hypothetical protein [Bradyrhizobium cytisi]TYL71018.1 hypothetical protein FXB38_40775 [Bradyrhizobium cytisi]
MNKSDELDHFKKNMSTNPAARAKFIVGILGILEEQGVDINDPAVLKKFGVHIEIPEKNIPPSVMSTNIITVTT